MAQIGVSDDVKAEIEKYAKNKDISITDAANKLFAVAASRLASVKKWAGKKAAEKVPEKVEAKPKAVKKISEPKAKAPTKRKAKTTPSGVDAPTPV